MDSNLSETTNHSGASDLSNNLRDLQRSLRSI